MTRHSLVERDCRDLSFIPDGAVDLILTRPPSFGRLGETRASGQFSAILEYDHYLTELESVLAECERVLASGGSLVCIASPAARSEEDLPLAVDVHARASRYGLRLERTIRWLPSTRAELDPSKFYGAPNQPCGELVSESHEILVMKKPGKRVVPMETQVASRLPADLYAACASTVWLVPGGTEPGYPQGFPVELAERLIRTFSYVGDTVLDPFAGIGTTSEAAQAWGRNSIAIEIERRYFDSITDRLTGAEWPNGEIEISRGRFARVPMTQADALTSV